MKNYNWGVIGTGWIAHEMGDALTRVHGRIYGVCSARPESAKKYAKEYQVEKVYESADQMLGDGAGGHRLRGDSP